MDQKQGIILCMPTSLPVVILHGWNGNPHRWVKTKTFLEEKGFRVFIPQLAGFSEDTETPWTLDDSVNWVVNFINSKHLKKVILICHSNGGRIGMKLAVKYPDKIGHLFLINSAGIRTSPRWKRRLTELTAKSGKLILRLPFLNLTSGFGKKLLYKLIREHDYERASPILKKTLVNILEEDLSTVFPNIKTPTTLIWGTEDRLTPPTSAVKLHQAIPQSELLWISGAGHALPFTHTEKLALLIEQKMSIH